MSGRKIFVCYRREDSAGHAGRLYDRLNLRFPGRVFMDVAGIGLGTRWADVIEQTLASCEVVLLLVGRRWLEQGEDGTRRIDNPDDPLRAEITTALKLQRRIVPVLVGGAALPASAELPPDVAPAVDWQALRVDDDDFDHDAGRLTRALEGYLQEEAEDPHLEKEASRRAKVEALFAESARAVKQGAWVTAAQTLRSVLSLDPGNTRAAHELRDVEARWAAAYRQGQSSSVVVRRRGPLAVFGVIGAVVVLFGVGAVALLIVGVMLLDGNPGPQSAPVPFYDGPDAPPLVDVDDDDAGATAAPSTVASLVGAYVLSGYSQHGIALPVEGQLMLASAGAERLRFEIRATNRQTMASFWYRGVIQHQNGAWSTTTTESNDPTAISHPIPTTISFDGSALMTTNTFGEVAVWHRQ